MKKLTKLFALMLAVVMVTGCFASCGEEKTGSTNTTFKLGGIGPLTGGAAQYGISVKQGIELAVKEINEAGGVNGVKFEISFQDDEHDAQKAINAYGRLKDENVHAIIGTVTSTPCISVVSETAADNMFQLTPSGSAVECISGENAFRVCFSDPNQGAASAKYIATNKLGSKIAVFYNSGDAYSQGIYKTFKAEATTQNLEIVSEQSFTDANNTDFNTQIQKIKESGAELVFLPIYSEQAATFLQQANKAGLKAKYFGCDGLDGTIDKLGDDASLAEGVMLLTPFAADSKDEKSQAFTAAYKAAYNDAIPDQFAADGYDAVYIIKAAMEKANITDPSITYSDFCNKLKAVMTEITVDGVTGSMTWSKDGEPTKDPKAMVISEGAYKAM